MVHSKMPSKNYILKEGYCDEKKIGLVIFLILMLFVGMFTGCGLKKTIDAARDVVNEYYDAFSDGDIETVVDLMHESLIENLGGRNESIAFFSSIRAVHGMAVDYTFQGFETEKFTEGTTVAFTIATEYEFGDATQDNIVVADEKGVGMSILSIEIPTAGIIETITEDIITAYMNNDLDALYAMVIPATKSIEGIEASFYEYFNAMYDAVGPARSLTNTDLYPNLYESILDGEAILVCVDYLTFECENGFVTMEVYLAEQNGKVGIGDIIFEE